jgi:NADH:ubiquinone oxidoreductase subunit D
MLPVKWIISLRTLIIMVVVCAWRKECRSRFHQGPQVIRVLMDELTRLASHQLWWGAGAMDIGALTPFFHAFREREMINDIMEGKLWNPVNHELYGARRCDG